MIEETDLTLLPRAEEDTKEEPPKKWFNWWRNHGSEWTSREGWRHPRGVYRGFREWPSKDTAESSAARWFTIAQEPRISLSEYLGAFPEGERPDV